MRFEDLEVVPKRLIPDKEHEVSLLGVAMSRASGDKLAGNNGPQVGRPMGEKASSHALLGLRQLAVEYALETGEYFRNPNAVPILDDRMTQEDLAKLVELADARVQALTGGPE